MFGKFDSSQSNLDFKDIQSFLGFFRFITRHIGNCSSVLNEIGARNYPSPIITD